MTSRDDTPRENSYKHSVASYSSDSFPGQSSTTTPRMTSNGSSHTPFSPFPTSSERLGSYMSSPLAESSQFQDESPPQSLAFLPSTRLSPSLGHSPNSGMEKGGSASSSSTYTPPPRRVGSSIPSPGSTPYMSTSSPHILPSSSPFASSSSSTNLSNTARARSHKATRILHLSYEGLVDLLNLIHPSKWSPSAHLTDQASIALISYKLYALSITLPPWSKIYFYYAPSCLLSDLVAVLLLQVGWWLAFGRRRSKDGSAVSTPRIGHDAGKSSGKRSWSGMVNRRQKGVNWRQSILNFIKNPADRLFRSYDYTALSLETSTIPQVASSSPETPTLRRTSSRNGNINENEVGGRGGNAGLGISAEEEGRSLLFDWKDDETPTRSASHGQRASVAHPGARTGIDRSDLSSDDTPHTNKENKIGDRDEYHEDITMVEGDNDDDEYNDHLTKSRITEYDEDLLRSTLGTQKRTWKSFGNQAFWMLFRTLHVVACLVAIVFTVIAIGAYSAGRVVFSWQGAFDSGSQSGYLLGYAMTEFPHFLYAYLTIFTLGTLITLLRCWIPRWIDDGTVADGMNKYRSLSSKIRIGIISMLVIGFIAICAAIRPPNALPATDLLIDGVTATSAILLFSEDHTHPIALNKNTTIYGQSNAFQPRLTPIDSDKIEHVFFIFLESADHLAWPYQPDQFCKHRNCEDMPEEYNKVEEFTPFFNSLIKNDEHTVFIDNFRTNLAYTIKSHLGSMCGVMPHVRDFVGPEAEMNTPTGCLPHIVKQLNSQKAEDGSDGEGKWKTGWFQAQMTAYDKQAETIRKQGFDEIWDSNTLTAKMGKKEYTNYFGYSDEELHPFVWEWIDDRLKNKEKIFMAMPGSTMHHPFSMPPFAESFEYTKTEWTNNYLNVVKRTDADLKRFFDNLKKRNLLDKSLIIMQGDHGPRIGEDGVYVDSGWHERIYRSPLAIRAPGLIPKQIEQDPLRPFLTIDITPTILDALGINPSIIKSFVGQSIFRARSKRHIRDSYHAQSRGAQFPHHLRLEQKHSYKAVRMMENPDTCAVDLNVDPSETLFYCVNEGWRKIFQDDVLTDGISNGMYKEGSKEEKKLIEYAHEAKRLIDTHLEINAAFWDVEKKKDENEGLMNDFLQHVHEQAHWH